MFQKFATASFLFLVGLGFPILILCRPAPPREPLTLHNIQRVGDLRWEAHYKAKPILGEIEPWAELIKEQLGTTEEPTIRIEGPDATIEFKTAMKGTLMIDSILRIRSDEEQSAFGVVTTPWRESPDELASVASGIRNIDRIPTFKKEEISVVEHPHNQKARYVLLSFISPAETY